jgi:hypothetical protein
MKTSKLNLLRWIFFLLSGPLMIMLVEVGIDFIDSELIVLTFVALWLISTIILLILFIYKNSTISTVLKNFIVALIPFLLFLYLLFAYVLKSSNLIEYLTGGVIFFIIYSTVLSIICFYEKIGNILVGLIFTILFGFVLNRIGASEGGAIIQVSFLLSSLGFSYLLFKTIRDFKSNKPTRRIFMLFYGAIAVLDIVFFLKFIEVRPAFNSAYDIIGVIIFLLACMLLFIILPFSNFIEWSKSQKQAFKRLIILPLILFLLIFSLKFLLPGNVYRKIFFKEYSEAKKIYFEMKDYEVDFKSE